MSWTAVDTKPTSGADVWVGAENIVGMAFWNGVRWVNAYTSAPITEWEPTHWQPVVPPTPPVSGGDNV